MKKLILSTILSAAAFTVTASEEAINICTQAGEMAEVTMKARQSGIPMSKLMSISNVDSFTDELIM